MAEPATQSRPARPPLVSRELSARIASSLVLAGATIALTWSGLWPFALLVLAVALIVLWEWGRVVRQATLDTLYWASAAVVAAALGLATGGRPMLGLLVVAAGAAGVGLRFRAADGMPAALGIVYAGIAAVALVWLRAAPRHGLEAIVLLLLIVWAADSGAFACGRLIGGPKLWPQVSPNKTWAGLCGALAMGGLAAWAFAFGAMGGGAVRSAMVGVGLAFVSQCGDLLESAIKRRHGVKDASSLIPGHGGFMDRVDGLIFAAIAAALYALAVDSGAPAAALLSLR